MVDSHRMLTVASPSKMSEKLGLMRAVGLGVLSAVLLDLPFPLAGPLPPWRAAFAWIALVPLLYAVLAEASVRRRGYLWRSALAAYVCGVLWYVLNCYWIYATMHIYGGIGVLASVGILLLMSLVLGLYFGVFGLVLALFRRAFRRPAAALLIAPFVWVALEFAASRITSVPWDQLGYSQVDNLWLTRLAPFTGVYGISFVLMAVNALFAAALLRRAVVGRKFAVAAVVVAALLQSGSFVAAPPSPTEATAVLLQDNLSVTHDNDWVGPEWDEHTAEFLKLSEHPSDAFFTGLPGAHSVAHYEPYEKPSLIVWPEAPSPFREKDPRFRALMAALAEQTHSSIVAGNIAIDRAGDSLDEYNSASVIGPHGNFIGRYDKIHLVPFGEYVPYRRLFFFAGHLTQNVSDFSRGKYRKVFLTGGHSYGVFICYESIFASEVRQFAWAGAQVFVNISDDAWYGDTSAPWQHLNMARMRAIENHRWILLDTNTGVTAAVDPLGRVTQSAPRHVRTSLKVRYGYRDEMTLYTRFGDWFAILCVIIAIVGTVSALRRIVRQSS